MEVLKITDNPDGSATVTLEISEEENNLLIQYAITNILKEEIKKKEIIDTEGVSPEHCHISWFTTKECTDKHISSHPLPPPLPPPGRIISEDRLGLCSKCGSSLKWKFWPFVKSKYCIQPKCENYYGKILY